MEPQVDYFCQWNENTSGLFQKLLETIMRSSFFSRLLQLLILGWLILGYSMALAEVPVSVRSQAPVGDNKSEQIDRFYSETISTVLADSEKVVTMLAIFGGGIWVYFNFLRGRVYHPRLELSISGRVTNSSPSLVVITMSLRNVGLSRVVILQNGTCCRVSLVPKPLQVTEPLVINDWVQASTSQILADHQWIEPGEVIVEQPLVALPATTWSACQIAARVVGQGKEWNAMAVVTPDVKET